MRSLREQGLVTSALAIVGAVTGFASNGSLEEKDRKSAAYSGGAGKTHWIDVTAMSPPGAEPSAKGRKCAAGPAVIGARLPLDC